MAKGIKLHVVEAQNVTLARDAQTHEHHTWVGVHLVRAVCLKNVMMVRTLILMKLQAQITSVCGGGNLLQFTHFKGTRCPRNPSTLVRDQE